jgi:hypothetical protein
MSMIRSKMMSVTAMEMMVSALSTVLPTTHVRGVGIHEARSYG